MNALLKLDILKPGDHATIEDPGAKEDAAVPFDPIAVNTGGPDFNVHPGMSLRDKKSALGNWLRASICAFRPQIPFSDR